MNLNILIYVLFMHLFIYAFREKVFRAFPQTYEQAQLIKSLGEHAKVCCQFRDLPLVHLPLSQLNQHLINNQNIFKLKMGNI